MTRSHFQNYLKPSIFFLLCLILFINIFLLFFTVTEAEKRRLQDAFRRLSASSGHVSRQVFIKEVVGDALPALLAEQIYRYPYYDNCSSFLVSSPVQIEVDFWINMNSFEQEYDIF